MKSFKLIVSTPDGNVLDGEAELISLRGTEGSLAVMAGHIPFITTTKEGQVKIITGDKEIIANSSSGVLTVTKEGVTLLCGTFEFNE